MNNTEKIIALEKEVKKLSLELEKLKGSNHESTDYTSWINMLDDNWRILFKHNVKNQLTIADWWKSADYWRTHNEIQIDKEFFEKSYSINMFSCRLKNETLIRSLLPLTHINNLIGLNCQGSSIDDLSPISHMTNMKYLDIRGSLVKDILPIKNFNSLESLNYQENYDEKVNDLSGFTKLKYLNLRYGNLTNITFVENFKDLETLSVGYTNLKSIKPLLNLEKLTSVKMPKTDVPESEVLELKEANPNCEIAIY